MSTSVLALCSLVLFGISTCLAFETYVSQTVEHLQDIQLLRLPKQLFVATNMDSPAIDPADFLFIKTYTYETLKEYFDGDNVPMVSMPQTTPMFYDIDIFDHTAKQEAFFLIPKERQRQPPATNPMSNMYFKEQKETYYFVRKTNETELMELMHAAADMLVDLSYKRMPFEGSRVYLVFYEYPYLEESEEAEEETEAVTETKQRTEIWVRRTMKEANVIAT